MSILFFGGAQFSYETFWHNCTQLAAVWQSLSATMKLLNEIDESFSGIHVAGHADKYKHNLFRNLNTEGL